MTVATLCVEHNQLGLLHTVLARLRRRVPPHFCAALFSLCRCRMSARVRSIYPLPVSVTVLCQYSDPPGHPCRPAHIPAEPPGAQGRPLGPPRIVCRASGD